MQASKPAQMTSPDSPYNINERVRVLNTHSSRLSSPYKFAPIVSYSNSKDFPACTPLCSHME